MTQVIDDFWGSAAETDVPPPPTPTFDTVPDKAWVLIKNTTREQKEGAQPKILTISGTNGDWYKFKTAFLVAGGDDKIKPAHVGRYIFYECNTHRHPEKDNQALPCGGQLYNLILDTLAPYDTPVAERWGVARAILAAKGQEAGLTKANCNDDTQYMYAAAFKEVLLDTAYMVIAQTYTPKPRPGKTYQPAQTVGSIMSAITANRTEKKVKVIEAEVKDNF